MKYTQKDIVRIAKRENNLKRGYLVVNPQQGKHVPVKPSKAIALFRTLAECIKDKYDNETLLVVGFAETATAIGAQTAIELQAKYIQTTREIISDADYLLFSEAHSHATEQKLVKDDIDAAIQWIDRIVFVEDEVTTGNTIMNIIRLLRGTYSKKINYTILSLLNGMDENAINRCRQENIDLYYIIKTDHSHFEEKADAYRLDGAYIGINPKENIDYRLLNVKGCMNARRLIEGSAYEKACRKLSDAVLEQLEITPGEHLLVLGTEEFMYPALYIGSRLEEKGCEVFCHATTRSPIAVSTESEYPLHVRYELESVYDRKRKTYIYDIKQYDRVIIVTDSNLSESGALYSLVNAVQMNNKKIEVVRWS